MVEITTKQRRSSAILKEAHYWGVRLDKLLGSAESFSRIEAAYAEKGVRIKAVRRGDRFFIDRTKD